MDGEKTVRLISNAIYAIGSAVVLALSIISLLGANEAVFPMAMIPFTYKELAFIWLAFGTVPMLLACMAVYKFNDLKNSPHKKRYFIFTFLPGFICSACALFVIGVIIAGYINSFIFN
ncbi:MAG: hypothetical protein BWY15_01590 [Firmicutes bacterium ADurb.Bin193]|nr:MAG: hypothetical protein BWY15_01590 [Firmicutes bacterium ADurb.Bin193]